MRHVLVHGYYTVDPESLWDTIECDIPELKPWIEKYLQEQPEQSFPSGDRQSQFYCVSTLSQPLAAQAPLADQNSGRAIAPPATSLALMLRARAWEWDKDPSSQEGDRGVEKSA